MNKLKLYNIELDLSPAKYNPNFNVIRKANPSISIGPHTTKHIGSMKNYMESFIRTILPSNESNNASYDINVSFKYLNFFRIN